MNKKEEKENALKSLNYVINERKDVKDAFMCQVGSVDLLYGEIGNPQKNFKGGFGVCHIIAKRDYERSIAPRKFRLTGL